MKKGRKRSATEKERACSIINIIRHQSTIFMHFFLFLRQREKRENACVCRYNTGMCSVWNATGEKLHWLFYTFSRFFSSGVFSRKKELHLQEEQERRKKEKRENECIPFHSFLYGESFLCEFFLFLRAFALKGKMEKSYFSFSLLQWKSQHVAVIPSLTVFASDRCWGAKGARVCFIARVLTLTLSGFFIDTVHVKSLLTLHFFIWK